MNHLSAIKQPSVSFRLLETKLHPAPHHSSSPHNDKVCVGGIRFEISVERSTKKGTVEDVLEEEVLFVTRRSRAGQKSNVARSILDLARKTVRGFGPKDLR
nr:PREDICTED: uncharacterized protein LOC105662745 [Megachile rotundata]